MNKFNSQIGFSMIEVIIVIIIAGILAAVALRSVVTMADTARVEEAKEELRDIEYAMVGNPAVYNGNTRADFGYVGHVGSMPPNLDALYSNPGGYATWKGPYVKRRVEQDAADYKTDPWGVIYIYSAATVTSTGSGSDLVRKFGEAATDFTANGTDGVILDLDGTPPGAVYNDSLSVQLTIPNGSGGYNNLTSTPDNGGYFSFNNVPIGNHDIRIVYTPTDDTLRRFVSVLPKSRPYGEYRLPLDVWFDTTAGGGGGGTDIQVISNSDTLYSSCAYFKFWITNTSASPISVSSIKLTWSSPTAYYEKVKWNGVQVADNVPRWGSGQTAVFDSPQTINAGENVMIQIEDFKDDPVSGISVNMLNVNFTIEFSDGSSSTILANLCP